MLTTETALLTEASAVERLRRQISEAARNGQSASPQLLADFAQAQKAYLMRKIEFEKARRSEGATVAAVERTGTQRVVATASAAKPETPPPLVSALAKPTGIAAFPPAPVSRAPARRILIFALMAVLGAGIGIALWVFARG
jgi:hypothetical protein